MSAKLWCSAVLAAALAMPAAAQEAAPRLQSGLKATDLFAMAGNADDAGQTREAEALYRALAKDPDLEIRSEARFRLGMMLDRAGRKRDAAIAFRALLDEKPDAPRVRIELARILVELGDESAARRELRQAQAGALPQEVAQIVDQFATALRSRKPFGASLELALIPDSNINRATDSQTLDTIIAPLELSRDARGQSGLGARIGGQAFFRLGVAPHLAVIPRVSAQGEFYRQSQFNDMSLSTQLGFEWSPGRERIRPSAGATFRYYGGHLYARTATASIDWEHPLGRRTQIGATATIAQSDYLQNDLQDGRLYGASFALEHALSPRSGGSLTLSGTRQTARDPGYATASGGASLLYYRALGRTTAFATLGIRRLEADQRLFLFPERRREWTYSAGAGATLRTLTFKGFAPLVRVEWERNVSTVGIYDYRRLAGTMGITRAF